jgi:hypothetical protein
VPREGVQHFTQRGVSAQKWIGLGRHCDFDAVQQCHARLIQEGEEEGLLAWEMKVEPTFGRIRGTGNLVYRGVAVTVLGKDLEGGVEHSLSPRPTSLLNVRHCSPAVKTDRPVGRIF